MKTMFKYFDIRKEENGPEVTSKIRWVINPMTEEEAKRLYMYLQEHFTQQEEKP